MNLLRTNYGSKEGEYAEVKAKHALLELRPMLVISKPRKKPDPNDAPTLIKIKKCRAEKLYEPGRDKASTIQKCRLWW